MTRRALFAAGAAAALGVVAFAWCLARAAGEPLTFEMVLREAEAILAVPTEGV